MRDEEPTWHVYDDPNEAGNICLYVEYKGRGTVFSLPRDDMYKMAETLVDFASKGISLPRSACRRRQSDESDESDE